MIKLQNFGLNIGLTKSIICLTSGMCNNQFLQINSIKLFLDKIIEVHV